MVTFLRETLNWDAVSLLTGRPDKMKDLFVFVVEGYVKIRPNISSSQIRVGRSFVLVGGEYWMILVSHKNNNENREY
jgi:hypothetical protein